MEISAPGAIEAAELKALTTPPGAIVGAETRSAGALVIARLIGFENNRPGFDTVMLALPAAARRLAGTAAVSCVALIKVVASAPLFQNTVEPGVKNEPNTVRVNAAEPSVTDDGLTVVATGVEAVTLNGIAGVAKPLGLVTVI